MGGGGVLVVPKISASVTASKDATCMTSLLSACLRESLSLHWIGLPFSHHGPSLETKISTFVSQDQNPSAPTPKKYP